VVQGFCITSKQIGQEKKSSRSLVDFLDICKKCELLLLIIKIKNISYNYYINIYVCNKLNYVNFNKSDNIMMAFFKKIFSCKSTKNETQMVSYKIIKKKFYRKRIKKTSRKQSEKLKYI
jgi:hypothetical protein